MLHQFILPNHMTNAVRLSLDQFAKEGYLFDVKKFEIDNNLTSFDKLILEIDAQPYDLLRMGIKIGFNLSNEEQRI